MEVCQKEFIQAAYAAYAQHSSCNTSQRHVGVIVCVCVRACKIIASVSVFLVL